MTDEVEPRAPEQPPYVTGDEVVTIQQFKVLVDSLVGSGGGGGNEGSTEGFSNFIPVDDLGIEAIAERIVGQENPALLCIKNNGTNDLLVVHIPGVNNSEIYIDRYETNVFSDMGCSAVNIAAANSVSGNVGVQILNSDNWTVVYHLDLDGLSENKDPSFDTSWTAFIMFLDGYYS